MVVVENPGVPQSAVTPKNRNGLWHEVTGLCPAVLTATVPSGSKIVPQYLSGPLGGIQHNVPSALHVTSDWAPGMMTKFL